MQKPIEKDESSLADKVSALEKELARVRSAKRDERDEEVVKLRERLAKMEGKLESSASGDRKSIKDYQNKELLAFKHQWDDVLDQARDSGDAEKVKTSKANIRAIEAELMDRGNPKTPASDPSSDDLEETRKELAAIYEETVKEVPDLADKNSELWKACKVWHDAHPALMKQLGPLGDMMAVSKVMIQQPELLKGLAVAARKEVIGNIEKATRQAIKSGGGATGVTAAPNFSAMSSDEFDKLEQRVMAGLPLTG